MTSEALALAPCAHCGLPSRGARYCCFGCELASELAESAGTDHSNTHGALVFSALLTMAVMMLSLFLYAEDLYDVDNGLAWLRTFYRWASWVLVTPVMVLCGGPLFRFSFKRAREGAVPMLGLIGVGAVAAYGLSVVALFKGAGPTYFETAAVALVLGTLGRYLEARAQSNASAILGPTLERGLDRAQRIMTPRVGEEVMVELAPDEFEPGDLVRVPADRLCPVDMRFESTDEGGDEARVGLGALTGESSPVVVRTGDVIPAGAVALQAAVRGECLRLARESSHQRLQALAESLRTDPSQLQRFADRLSMGLAPVAVLLAVGAGLVFGNAHGAGRGVEVALSVLLVACPCTYAISAPLVMWLVMRAGLSSGVLFRSAAVVEALSKVRAVAFDKTGTLTHSEVEVRQVYRSSKVDGDEVLGLLRAMEVDSAHPVGAALYTYAEGGSPAALKDIRAPVGAGIFAVDARGRSLQIGAAEDGTIALRRDGEVLARFEVGEALRDEAKEAVELCRASGLSVAMLTGDGEARASRVADQLEVEFEAGLSPEDKVARLAVLVGRFEVAMVGDGSNDAPALSGRCTGISMPGATGLSRGVAQVSLLEADLRLVPWSIALCRRAVRLVRRLLITSTLYNVVFLGLAASGTLRPVWAGVSMLLSSLLTVTAAASVSAWPSYRE